MAFQNEEDVQKFRAWLEEQLHGMNRHVQTSGLITTECTGHCAFAVPHLVFIGKIWPKGDDKNKYWVISGLDLPTDHIEENLAESPRDVAKHFSLKWQLQSAKVAELGEKENSDDAASQQTDWESIAGTLQSNAEALYTLVERDDLWDPEKTAVKNVLANTGTDAAS